MSGSDLSRPHVYLPGDGGVRTLLLLHGTGADEFDLLELGRALDPKANLLSPQGLVVENGMRRFFVWHPDGSADEESIIQCVDELALFVANASRHYGFDPGNVVAVGFSNGANTAGALMLLHPETVSEVVAFGTTKPFQKSPSSPNLRGKRVIIANGALDAYSPDEKTKAMIAEFKSLGAEVKLLMHPGGHEIAMDHVRQIAKDLSNPPSGNSKEIILDSQ